jgi:glucan 1,3-beta-glucosidase
LGILSLSCAISSLAAESSEATRTLPFLRGSGTEIVDEDEKTVVLRGCNLGNWLLIEPWMLGLSGLRDQSQIEKNLTDRFGQDEKDHLLNLFRENWITPRDFGIIRSWNFNVVRLPFNCNLLEGESNPGQLKPDAFYWLDRAVEMAEEAGIYVILDMHGAPGGQSLDGITGQAGRNQFWKPENRKRGAFIWQKIAEHFRDNPTVAAYDLLNEPFGMMNSDNHDADLVGAMDQLVHAIREVDEQHLIFVAGSLRGIEMYGDPRSHGWKNVGFTEHFYPGVYGGTASLETHARFIGANLAGRLTLLDKWNVPYLAGEFNVVFDRAGGADMMRRYFDEFAKPRWAATLWSYKLLKADGGAHPDHWYMVTNKDPLKLPQFSADSREELSEFCSSLSSMPYSQAADLRDAMTAESASPLLLGKYSPVELPGSPVSLKDWADTNVGNSFPKGGHTVSEGVVQVFGGGRDIYEGNDEFHFVARPVRSAFDLSAQVGAPAETNEFAKSGLMFRASAAANAPFVMVNLFPAGKCALAYRKKPGERITEEQLRFDPDVVALRLARRGDTFQAAAFDSHGKQLAKKSLDIPELAADGKLGFFVLSHDAMILSEAKFSNIKLETTNLSKFTEEVSAAPPRSDRGMNSSPVVAADHALNGSPVAAGDYELLPATGPYGEARVKRNIPYVSEATPHQNFDLYLPKDKGAGPFPLIAWMHGGAWMTSNKEWNNVKYLVHQGYAIASIDYRLSNEAAFPAQIRDCNAALNFVLAHAAEYEVDPTRYAIGGASAGAHLALLLGLARNEPMFGASSSRPVAILDFFGPSDLTKLLDASPRKDPNEDAHLREAAIKLLDARPEQLREKARMASPVTYLTMRSAPVLILHGMKDNLVPVSQSQELHSLLNTVGVKNELITIDSAGHDGDLFSTPNIQAKVIAFLKEAFPRR